MVSNKTSKFIKSLQLKKNRLKEKKFVVEGTKSVNELFESTFSIHQVIATDKYLSDHEIPDHLDEAMFTRTTVEKLSTLSNMKLNDTILAVASFRAPQVTNQIKHHSIILDGIKDPGNLGTIIRIADWYGIKNIYCSEDSVDFYNPKVIQSTMGSFTRVDVHEINIIDQLKSYQGNVLGAFMNGKSIHDHAFNTESVVVIGNESNGVSAPVSKLISDKITIPKYGKAESLNAGIATAIICDYWAKAING